MDVRIPLLTLATLLLAAPGAASASLPDAPEVPDVDIVCADNPAGWTVCFAYGALTVACPALGRVDLVQCFLNAEVDNAQWYAERMCTYVFQQRVCDQPPVTSPDEDSPVTCVDDPVGWTVCYVLGVPLIAAFGCPAMQMDSEWGQCVVNRELDFTQAYQHRMCDHVFQPLVCDLVAL